MRLAQPAIAQVAKLVVDTRFPAVQDVHRQVLQALGNDLRVVGIVLACLAQAIAECWDGVVHRFGVVDPMFEHDQVGRELIEMPAVATASHVGLDAGLKPVVKARALLG